MGRREGATIQEMRGLIKQADKAATLLVEVDGKALAKERLFLLQNTNRERPLADALDLLPLEEDKDLCGVFVPIIQILVDFLLVLFVSTQIVSGIANSILGLAHSIVGLTFGLFGKPFGLRFLITCPLASLTLNAASSVFHLAFNTVLIHKQLSLRLK